MTKTEQKQQQQSNQYNMAGIIHEVLEQTDRVGTAEARMIVAMFHDDRFNLNWCRSFFETPVSRKEGTSKERTADALLSNWSDEYRTLARDVEDDMRPAVKEHKNNQIAFENAKAVLAQAEAKLRAARQMFSRAVFSVYELHSTDGIADVEVQTAPIGITFTTPYGNTGKVAPHQFSVSSLRKAGEKRYKLWRDRNKPQQTAEQKSRDIVERESRGRTGQLQALASKYSVLMQRNGKVVPLDEAKDKQGHSLVTEEELDALLWITIVGIRHLAEVDGQIDFDHLKEELESEKAKDMLNRSRMTAANTEQQQQEKTKPAAQQQQQQKAKTA